MNTIFSDLFEHWQKITYFSIRHKLEKEEQLILLVCYYFDGTFQIEITQPSLSELFKCMNGTELRELSYDCKATKECLEFTRGTL